MRERRRGVWQLRVALGRGDDGRYRTVTRTHYGNKTTAQRALTDLLVEARGIRAVQPGGPATLRQLIAEWVRHIEADRSPTTIVGYNVAARRIPARLLDLPLERLSTADLDGLYRAMRAGGAAPATVRQTHAVIRRALAQGVRWGFVPGNVAAVAEPPTVRAREATLPSVEQVRLLRDTAAVVDPPLVLLIRVAAATGLRRGELAGMQWGDVAEGVLSVRRNIVTVAGAATVKPPKSWASRTLRLDRRTAAELEAVRPVAGGWVWSERGEPWHPDTFTARFERVRRAAGEGVAAVRLHDLRHFHASQLLARGIDPAAVAKRLGHRSVTTTMSIYAHALPARDVDAAEAIGDVLDDEPQGS